MIKFYFWRYFGGKSTKQEHSADDKRIFGDALQKLSDPKAVEYSDAIKQIENLVNDDGFLSTLTLDSY
jgi:hypothetical protein